MLREVARLKANVETLKVSQKAAEDEITRRQNSKEIRDQEAEDLRQKVRIIKVIDTVCNSVIPMLINNTLTVNDSDSRFSLYDNLKFSFIGY